MRAQRFGFLPRGSQDHVYKERAGRDLDTMRAEARNRFRSTRPGRLRFYISFGLGIVVAVPGFMVYGMEGYATGLHGSCSGGT